MQSIQIKSGPLFDYVDRKIDGRTSLCELGHFYHKLQKRHKVFNAQNVQGEMTLEPPLSLHVPH